MDNHNNWPTYEVTSRTLYCYTFAIVDKQENVYSFIVKSQNNKDRTVDGA